MPGAHTLLPRAEDCLTGGGEMGALMRATDWASTIFGPVSAWPQSLRTIISTMLESRFAMVVAWGPDFRFFYNDRYRPVLGKTKHPSALGARSRDIFPEAWPFIGPLFERTRAGEAVALDDVLIPLDRNGYLENCWFTLSYSPIRDESGGVGGMLAVVAETTERVQGERRLATLRELLRAAGDARKPETACKSAVEILARNAIDVPFSLLYLVDEDGTRARLAGGSGIEPGHPAAPELVELGVDPPRGWPIARAIQSGRLEFISDVAGRFGALTGGPYPEPAHAAVIVPLAKPGREHPYAIFIAGVSPRRALDDAYHGFFELVADHISSGVANALAFEAERKRAEALAELDRAKTVFFSNVSHEFRTPLTLMLGPTERMLSGEEGELHPAQREQLALVHRNAVRLQKLVNTLLDFSRIEAGRIKASFEYVDLAALTSELSSTFRSAIERAGLRMTVACDPLDRLVPVDREMWEKIVLNLISNAFKFTFEGEIEVRSRRIGDELELSVRDTGIGISSDELPRVFDRFHRIEGAKSRTHEGSGIGLALTRELVRMHDGEILVESELGKGSRFVVRMPLDRPAAAASVRPRADHASTFKKEAEMWIAGSSGGESLDAASARKELAGARILLADDNADMRDYIARLLREHGARVRAEANGALALEAVRAENFDLVLTDVMMPELDGFGLLEELRSNDATSSIPVIMISARAGEDELITGRLAGAEDYIIKPFSAKELIARVHSQLALSSMRAAIQEERHLLLAREQIARREAELQKDHLHTLFMQAPTPIVILRGKDFVVELANAQACEVWGRKHEEVIDRPLLEALPELRGQEIPELLRNVIENGESHVGREMPVGVDRRGDGSVENIYFNFVYTPLRNHEGSVEGVLVLAFDVSHEVAARARLDELRHDAESANRAKDDFLAMLGHELRNPLAPITTALLLLRMGGDHQSSKELTVIERQVGQLSRLVDDLLDVSRIARGKIELERKPIELAEIITRAIETASPLLEQRRHELSVDVPKSGLIVAGDSVRLSQAISNVVMNAAKYTETGGRVGVKAWRAGDEVIVEISDTGMGISKEMLPRVFDLFTQERQALDRSRGGLGLGLAIVKSLVEIHGGRVTAASAGRNKGSTFTIVLPLLDAESAPKVADETVAMLPSSLGATKRRVLIVDDNSDAAEMLSELLTDRGFDARVARDGPAALKTLAEFDPDVCLLDIGLPVMDGYELAARIRVERPENGPRLLAVTGYGQESDRERSLAAGFEGHLVKPVNAGKLLDLLETTPIRRAQVRATPDVSVAFGRTRPS